MVSKQTFQFLSDLSANNHREWFADNKKRYDAALAEMKQLAKEWIEGAATFEEDAVDNDPAKAIFRIYRDTRFSTDKTPYKNHFGLVIGRGGRTSNWAAYYLHISPGASFLAGGKWMPVGDELKKIRQEIDYNHLQLTDIFNQSDFKTIFGDMDREMVLKKAPKDYPTDHPAIEWLKLKSFTVSCEFSDEEVLSSEFIRLLIRNTRIMMPFIQFLNAALEDA